jgi:hypothetical protein
MIAIYATFAMAETRANEAPESLTAAIKAKIKKPSGGQPEFDYALADLNGDGNVDAVVLLKGSAWCGSGGCTLLIFKGKQDGFEFISKSTITSEPIRISPEKSHGWRTLIVYTGGVGDVVMRFNGTKYPPNPSMQAKATKAQVRAAEIVLK